MPFVGVAAPSYPTDIWPGGCHLKWSWILQWVLTQELIKSSGYFKIKFESDRLIADIQVDPKVPPGYSDLVALSQYQFRETEGLNFPSVAETAVPTFFAATLSHLAKIAPQVKPPASLCAANDSAGLFSVQFKEANQDLLDWGASPEMCDPKVSNGQLPDQRATEVFDLKAPFLTPHIDLVGRLNPIPIDKRLVTTKWKATNQAQLLGGGALLHGDFINFNEVTDQFSVLITIHKRLSD